MRLKTLGGLSIQLDDGRPAGAAAQRRRLAMLALLAGAGERGLSRDKLIGYLWAESDPEKARRILAQGLYAIRRDLGADDLFLGTTEIRLNSAVLGSDLVDFRTALADGRLEQAVGVYGGPFLDGFYLSEAPEFERWVETERADLAHRYAAALEQLAARAKAAGDLRAAVGWWRRLAAADPLSSRVAVGLMEALAAAGDRGGALQHARVYETLLRQELDVEPDREVVDAAARIRQEPVVAVPRVSSRGGAADEVIGSRHTGSLRGAAGDEAIGWRGGDPPLPTAPSSRFAWLAGVSSATLAAGLIAASVVVLLGVLLIPDGEHTARGAAASRGVVVLPFSVRGGPDYAYLSEGMVDLLSATFDGAGTYTSIDAHSALGSAAHPPPTVPAAGAEVARQLGAGHFLLGDVVEVGGKLRISAALYPAAKPSSPVAQGTVEGNADSLFRLVDELTRQLLAPRARNPQSRLVQLAAVTTTSLPALKAYLEGEREFREYHLARAIEAFQRATELDSTFALAWYRTGLAASWALNGRLARHAAERAGALAGRLPPRDRLLIAAFRAYVDGSADEAELRYRSVVSPYPDDIEGWVGLGEVLFHNNWTRGRSVTESRGAWEQALALDPTDWQVILHLGQVAAFERKAAERDSLHQRLLATWPDTTPLPLFWRVQQAVAARDVEEQTRLLAELRRSPSYFVTLSVLYAALYGHDLAAADSVAARLVADDAPAESKPFGHLLLAHLRLARGRWRDAEAQLDTAARLDPVAAAEARASMLLVPFVPATPDQLRSARAALIPPAADSVESLQEPRGFATVHDRLHAPLMAYLRAGLSTRLGEYDAATREIAALDALAARADAPDPVREMGRDLALGMRARIAWARGRNAPALAELERMRLKVPFELGWYSPYFARLHERWLRAELLNRTGRAPDALGWYGSFAENSVYDLVYLGPAALEQAQIYEGENQPGRAAERYRELLAVWRDADPELRPLVAQAEQRLIRLTGRAEPR